MVVPLSNGKVPVLTELFHEVGTIPVCKEPTIGVRPEAVV
jgi:hypothetical protein